MPLFDDVPCKVCSKGRLPPGSQFCPNCGRPVHWTESPAGRRRAAGVGVAVMVAVVLLAGFVLLSVTHVSRAPRPAAVVSAGPTISSPPPSLTRMPSAFPPVVVPQPPRATLPANAGPPEVPPRAGDTDLVSDALAAYAGGPNADRLTVRGVRLGLPAAAVPRAISSDRTDDHLAGPGGDVYALDAAGRVSEIHVRDAAVLGRLPIDSTNALIGHFGQPDNVYTDPAGDLYTYLYPGRGVDVRWDAKAGRIDELVLRRPGVGR